MEKTQIYKLPMDFDGILAVIKNHDQLIKLFIVADGRPPRSGYTRYKLVDDTLVDINLDEIEFADFYKLGELEKEEN